jgi:hypothetical protein
MLGRSADLLHRSESTCVNEQSTQDVLQNIAHCSWRLMCYTVTNYHLIINLHIQAHTEQHTCPIYLDTPEHLHG